MLVRAIPNIIPVRKQSTQNFRSNLYARVQRAASPLVVLLGKREVWREKTRFIEKNGFSLSTKFNSFSKLTPPGLGILFTPNRINNFIRKAQSWLSG